jgi:pimeloyl-ACP methyl ester carboxylesterase
MTHAISPPTTLPPRSGAMTTTRSHSGQHRLRTWFGRGLGAVVVVGLALAATGWTFQTIATGMDQRAHPAPGLMTDVNGYRLHVRCTGQGSPAVILETGLGAWSSHWALVQPVVAEVTRVCSYDRAGLGWSDNGRSPRDARQIATELHALLGTAGIAGPYVLAGHSNGGLYARMFAGMYSDEVVGMVLADATPVDLFERLPAQRADFASVEQQARTFQVVAPFGIVRLLIGSALSELDRFPAAERAEIAAIDSVPRQWQGMAAEIESLQASMAQVGQLSPLGALPLVVLSSTEGAGTPEEARIKRQMSAEMAELSSNSREVQVTGATHTGLAVNPDHASVMSGAIRQVLDAARKGQPLP